MAYDVVVAVVAVAVVVEHSAAVFVAAGNVVDVAGAVDAVEDERDVAVVEGGQVVRHS